MCGGPKSKWKKEAVPEYEFDYMNISDYRNNSRMTKAWYIWTYFNVLKAIGTYIADIIGAITMLASSKWSDEVVERCMNTQGCFVMRFSIGKWIFSGSVLLSFVLLFFEWRKSRGIIISHNIALTFTNEIANIYFSIRSYDHFCFFEHLQDSTTKMDDLSFKVFFAFQGSVRLLLSEAPRQVINAVMLHALWFLRTKGKGNIFSKFFSGYSKTTTLLTVTASFSVLVFAGSLLLLLFAVVCYVPLYFFKVRGNLTNYVCHRVNKRILEIVKREARRRALHSVKLEKAAISDPVKNRITDRAGKTIPQPTLPKFSLDVALDEEIDLVALKERLRKEGTESFETEKGDDGDEKVDDDDIELVLECPSPIESTDNESVDSFEITVIPPDSPPLLEEDAPSQYHTNDLLSGTRKKTRHRKHKRRRSSPEKEVETPTPEITVPRIARRRLGRMPSLEMDEVSDTIDYYLPEARAPLETDRSPV